MLGMVYSRDTKPTPSSKLPHQFPPNAAAMSVLSQPMKKRSIQNTEVVAQVWWGGVRVQQASWENAG